MVMRNLFFFFPIHGRSQDKYYSENEAETEKNKAELERQYNKSFDELPIDLQIQYEHGWHWPYWLYNDIVGFIEIGMDGANHMTGNIFLKRKYHPRTSIWRQGGTMTTLENQQMLYYSEIDKIKVDDLSDNKAFISALEKVIERAKDILKERNRGFKIWLPYFLFNHIDFVELYKELNDK